MEFEEPSSMSGFHVIQHDVVVNQPSFPVSSLAQPVEPTFCIGGTQTPSPKHTAPTPPVAAPVLRHDGVQSDQLRFWADSQCSQLVDPEGKDFEGVEHKDFDGVKQGLDDCAMDYDGFSGEHLKCEKELFPGDMMVEDNKTGVEDRPEQGADIMVEKGEGDGSDRPEPGADMVEKGEGDGNDRPEPGADMVDGDGSDPIPPAKRQRLFLKDMTPESKAKEQERRKEQARVNSRKWHAKWEQKRKHQKQLSQRMGEEQLQRQMQKGMAKDKLRTLFK